MPIIDSQLETPHPFTELILDCIQLGQNESALKYFSQMRKDQRRQVLLNMIEVIYDKEKNPIRAAFHLKAIRILIPHVY